MSADNSNEHTTHDTSPAATTQSRIQSKQSTIYPIEPASRKLETLDLTAYESNIYTGTNIPSPRSCLGAPRFASRHEENKTHHFSPKETYFFDDLYACDVGMRTMSLCAQCNKDKETQEPGQGRDILLVHCTEVCAISLLGRGQFDIALASPCICILGRFFHAAKKMLALKNPHITYPEGQLGKFR